MRSRKASTMLVKIAQYYLEKVLKDRFASFNLDSFARLSILEGAAGVTPGQWLRKGARGFDNALEFFGAHLAESWTSPKDQGVYNKAIHTANKFLSSTSGIDAEDLVQNLIVNSTHQTGPDRTRLFYTVGAKLRSHQTELGGGKVTPKDSAVMGAIKHWVTHAAISELRNVHHRKTILVDPTKNVSSPSSAVKKLDSDTKDSLILLAIQSPGGPGNEIRRIVDRLIDHNFPKRSRPVVRLFLEKLSQPKYRSVDQMKKLVNRFDPQKWFGQAFNLIRKELMEEMSLSPQQVTNALGGKASLVLKFMHEKVGKDPAIKRIVESLAQEIDLLEPGVSHVGKEHSSKLPEKQIPKDPWSTVLRWLQKQKEESHDDQDKTSEGPLPTLDQHFERNQDMSWSHQMGPFSVHTRGAVPLRIGGEEETETVDVLTWLGTPPQKRTTQTVKDEKGNIFTGLVKIDGNPSITNSEITDSAQVNNEATVSDSLIEGFAIVEDHASVSHSTVSNHSRIRGFTVIENAKITGGSWDGQRLNGREGTFEDSYSQETLDVLMSMATVSPGPGDSPVLALIRYFEDGGSTTGAFGIEKSIKPKVFVEKVQKYIYSKYDKTEPRLGQGVSLLDELSESDLKKLIGAAKEKSLMLQKKKARSRHSSSLLKAVTELVFTEPSFSKELTPLVRLGFAARFAAKDLDMRGVLIRIAYNSKDSSLRKALLKILTEEPSKEPRQVQASTQRYKKTFLRWVSSKKFPHPESDEDVVFFNLPKEEQDKVYKNWKEECKEQTKRFMPKELGEHSRVTSNNFETVEVGDVLWSNLSPKKFLKVMGVNRDGWRMHNPSLDLVQITLESPDFHGESRVITKSSLLNPYLELHKLSGFGPSAQRAKEAEEHKRQSDRIEQLYAELPREPRGGWPTFETVGVGDKKQKCLQELFKRMRETKELKELTLNSIEKNLEKALEKSPSRKVVKEFLHALVDWCEQLIELSVQHELELQEKVYRAIRSKLDQGIRKLDGEERKERKEKHFQKAQEKAEERARLRMLAQEQYKDRQYLKGGSSKKLEDVAELTPVFIRSLLPQGLAKEVKQRACSQLEKAKYQDLCQMLDAAKHILDNWESAFAKEHALVKHLNCDQEFIKAMIPLVERKLTDVHGRTYSSEILEIANKYGLDSEDVDNFYDWKLEDTLKGEANSSDREKFNRFLSKTKPETREKMQDMGLLDFLAINNAILEGTSKEESPQVILGESHEISE